MNAEYMDLRKKFGKVLDSMAGRYNRWDIFTDWATMAAISLQNAVWFRQEYEDEYLRIAKKYKPEELSRIAELLAIVTQGLSTGFCDFVGDCFMNFGMGANDKGQFFTPYHIGELMGEMTLEKEKIAAAVAEKGYVTMMDCACGCSALLIGGAEAFQKAGYNHQQQLLVYANDIDRRCALCSYIQLSLFGIPAIVTVGDALTLEMHEEFHTPAYELQWYKFKNWRENAKNAPSGDEKSQGIITPPVEIKTPSAAAKQPTTGQLMLF